MSKRKVHIRGIWGWDAEDQQARRAQKRCEDPACPWNVIDALPLPKAAAPHGHFHVPSGGVYPIVPPEPQLSPEEVLAAIKKAAAEGNVALAIDEPPARGGVLIAWAIEDFGFGELVVRMEGDEIEVFDENLSRETCEEILAALVTNVPGRNDSIN